MSRFLLLTLLWLGITFSLLAQNSDNCEQTLNTATAEFEAGRFYSLPGILKPCLEKGFSVEQKVRAYLLLTQAYLVLNDPISAENSYLQLLKADPEYVANPSRDPIDVYYLSKKFTTTPIFTPQFRLGLNTSLPRTIYSVNTSSAQDQLSSSRIFKLGYQVGGGLDWNIDDKWSLCLGVQYAKKSFKTVLHDNNANSQETFTEKQDWIDLPIYIRYSSDSGKIRPFAYVGLAANLLIGSKLTLDNVDINAPSHGTQQVSQGPDVSITFKRNFFNRSLVFGGGAKYKVGKNFFYVDVRYMAGLTNLARNNLTLSNGQLDPIAEKYGYASDFFRLDNLSISFGYVKPLYNPRKKKTAVTSLLEKLGIKKSKK